MELSCRRHGRCAVFGVECVIDFFSYAFVFNLLGADVPQNVHRSDAPAVRGKAAPHTTMVKEASGDDGGEISAVFVTAAGNIGQVIGLELSRRAG